MTTESDEMLSLEQLQNNGRAVLQYLESGLTKEWDCLERPQVLAAMFIKENSKHEPQAEMRSLTLENTLAAYVGSVLGNMIPKYVELHAKLMERGLGAQNKFEIRNDTYVYAVADRIFDDPSPVRINWKAVLGDAADDLEDTPPAKLVSKAFVLETQNCDYLIVLNKRDNSLKNWTMHIRRLWTDIRPLLESGEYISNLEEYRNSTNLSILDVVKLARKAENYSDDLEGNTYPRRISLGTHLAGNLYAGTDGSGPGLQCGDYRDPGYIASIRRDGELYSAKGIAGEGYGGVVRVCSDINHATYDLCRTPQDD